MPAGSLWVHLNSLGEPNNTLELESAVKFVHSLESLYSIPMQFWHHLCSFGSGLFQVNYLSTLHTGPHFHLLSLLLADRTRRNGFKLKDQ